MASTSHTKCKSFIFKLKDVYCSHIWVIIIKMSITYSYLYSYLSTYLFAHVPNSYEPIPMSRGGDRIVSAEVLY